MEPAYTDEAADKALIGRLLDTYVVPHIRIEGRVAHNRTYVLTNNSCEYTTKDGPFEMLVDLDSGGESFVQSAADYLHTNLAEPTTTPNLWTAPGWSAAQGLKARLKLFLVGFTDTELLEIASTFEALAREDQRY